MRSDNYDVFLSYASEDRRIATELTWALQARGVRVWRDDVVLTVGDSLRRSIDDGLLTSSYGIVLLSEHFFAKAWPQRELDGLVTRELAEGRKVVLPIWHGIDVHTVREYSPPLADKVALNTSSGLGAVADTVASLLGLHRGVVDVAPPHFYYHRMTLLAEISHSGTQWTSVKRSTVVATADGLSGIATSYRIDDLVPGSLEERVEEIDVQVESLTADHPRAQERFFRFERPLRAGEERTVTYVRRFQKRSPQPTDMLLKLGASRCDEAVIEARFDMAPLSVVYRITDRSGVVKFHEESVHPEPGADCFRRKILRCDTALCYGLYWTYADQPAGS